MLEIAWLPVKNIQFLLPQTLQMHQSTSQGPEVVGLDITGIDEQLAV